MKRASIPFKNGTYDRFIFSFPSNLTVEKGLTYEYYFEVFDNPFIEQKKKWKQETLSKNK